jgi:signal transduction histidine kinase
MLINGVKIKKKIFFLILCAVLFWLSFGPSCYAAKIVKVGYIDYAGFIETTDQNVFQGYGVDFLEEIEKYSDLHFVYVKDTWQNCLKKILTGEIDMVCTAQKTPARELLYGFSKDTIGTESAIMYTRLNNADICFEEFAAFNGKRIGMVKSSFQNEIFPSYAAEHNFSCQKQFYGNENDMQEALLEGKIDLMLTGSMALHRNLKAVCEFGSYPFYLMTRKNNTELLDCLNQALDKITVKKPYFAMELYKKWYGLSATNVLPNYKREDIEFVENSPVLKIGLLVNYAPLSFYNRKTNKFEGIVPDVLDLIAKKSGFKFTYVPLKQGVSPLNQVVDNPDIDMAAGMVYTREITTNIKVLPSHPFMSNPLSALGRQGETVNLHKPLTVTGIKSAEIIIKYMRRKYPHFRLIYVDNAFAGAEAVKDRKADLFIMSIYALNDLLQRPKLEGLAIVPSIQMESGSCLITKRGPQNEQFLNVLNKTIDTITPDELNLIITNNTMAKPYKPTIGDLAYQYRYPLIVVGILLFSCLGLLYYTAKIKFNALTITQERNAQLKRAVAMAERASEAKSRFLASMSHDIRTPLNAIIGFTAIAQDEFAAKDAGIMTYLDKISLASKNLLGIVNNVLDMSAIENEKLKVSNSAFELRSLLEAEVAIYREECQRRGINLLTDFRLVYGIKEIGDSSKITRVLDNIISNAYKFTETGGTIKFIAEEKKHDAQHVLLHFSVMDTGCGMSEAMQKKLFMPFEQELDGAMLKNPGTGLGMSITKSIVSLMNGNITFKSKPGVGTTFDVNLLLDYIGSEKEATVIKDAAEKSLCFDFHGQRILLAEDNGINAEIVIILLKKVNLNVEVAQNGKIAVEKFTAHAADKYYAAIMMDIQMPELNGYEATEAIRRLNTTWAKQIPIIAITANAFHEDVAVAASVGMNEHISKPINKNRLYEVLGKYLA